MADPATIIADAVQVEAQPAPQAVPQAVREPQVAEVAFDPAIAIDWGAAIKDAQKSSKVKAKAPVDETPLSAHDAFWKEADRVAFDICKAFNTTTLEDIVRPLLRHPTEALLTMSGTPQQVLCQQFMGYALSSNTLQEQLTSSKGSFNRVVDAICRAPAYVPPKKSVEGKED